MLKQRSARSRRRLTPMGTLILIVGVAFGSILIGAVVNTIASNTLRVVPTPTQPFPVWWTVHPETTADGRTVYRVDQEKVKKVIDEHVREALRFTSYQDGLPDLTQAGRYMVEVAGFEALRATATAQGEYYWRAPLPETLNWQGEPEFSADGMDVTWTFFIDEAQVERERLFYEQVEAETGIVLTTVRMKPDFYTVRYHYDPQQGRWRLLN